ncbi:MAG: glycosyltransferase [Candidatus Hodarchaeota archaeon]
MKLVVTGTQLPFNRLIRTVDEWADKTKTKDVFAQIGQTDYKPKYIEWENFISPEIFRKTFEKADIIISHAGMGTILSALEMGKPILILPRLKKYNEHRNDHQIATAKSFLLMNAIDVAFNENELVDKLNSLDKIKNKKKITPNASNQLLKTLSDFINI